MTRQYDGQDPNTTDERDPFARYDEGQVALETLEQFLAEGGAQ